MNETPPDIGRSPFDEWCWRRGLELRDVADGLALAAVDIRRQTGREIRAPSIETVRRIRLPFTDGARRVPASDVVELIHRFTAGEITAGSFYPEHLRGAAAAPTARVA